MGDHHVDHFFKTLKREQRELPAEFNSSLHQKLVAVNVKQQKPVKSALLFKIIPALLVIAALFGGYHFFAKTTTTQKLTAAAVVQFDPVTVELTYIAAKPLKDVHFAINLQDGISFFSKHNEVATLKQHSWQGDLKKGVNKIPFVVSVDRRGKFLINTVATFSGYKHKHQITLKTGEKHVTVTYLELPKEQLDATATP